LIRLRNPFLLALLLALATAFVACGGSDNEGKSPETVLDEATLEGVQSGEIDLSLAIRAKGSEGGTLDVSLSGPFQGGGEDRLPRLDLSAKAEGRMAGEDIDFEGGLVLLPNKAYVGYEGVDYEVDPTTFSFVQATLEEAQQREGGGKQPPSLTACQEVAGELVVGDFADNLVNEGSADVDGTSTTKVSGDLDVPGALDALADLVDDPACKAQLGAAGPLPSGDELEKAKSEVGDALKRAHVEVFVGDDDIVRRIVAQLEIEPERSGSGPRSVDLDFDLTLTGVNEEQPFVAPSRAKPLNDLFLKLGVNPIELLGLLEGEGVPGGDGGLGGLLDGFGGGSSSGG
jgi:hypothetical protein